MQKYTHPSAYFPLLFHGSLVFASIKPAGLVLLNGTFMRFTNVETTPTTSRSATDTADSNCSRATPARRAKMSGIAGIVDRCVGISIFRLFCSIANFCRQKVKSELVAQVRPRGALKFEGVCSKSAGKLFYIRAELELLPSASADAVGKCDRNSIGPRRCRNTRVSMCV